MNKKIISLVLALIFSTSLFLRLYRIDLLPLYADETGHYQLLNLLYSHGQTPLTAIYNKLFYGSFTFTWLFGLSPLGVRLPSTLYGATTVLAIYLFAKSVSNKSTVALTTAVVAVFIPWLFMIGRIGHTSVSLLVLFVTLHIYFFLRSNGIRNYLVSLLFLGLAAFHYPSMVVIAPFAALLVLVHLFKLIPRKRHLPIFAVAVLVLAVCGLVVNNRFNIFSLKGRGLDLAIWHDVNTPYEIDRYRAFSWSSTPSLFSFGLPPEELANKLVYNRLMANVSIFTRNYLSFFSPDWLFLKGDPILRHSTGQVGAFFPFLAPFMFYGAFKFFGNPDKKKRITFLLWILVSPIPAAITKDGAGYLLRVVTMLPFLTYFCALGLVESFNLIKKKWRRPYGIVLALVGLYSAYYFFYGYFHVYPALSGRAYEYGFRELSDFQVSHQSKTMLIVWDGYYPLNHFLFWQKVPFTEYEKMIATPVVIGETTYWQTLPNLFFANIKQIEDLAPFVKQYRPTYIGLPDRYFVKYPVEIEDLLSPVEEIRYPDQSLAFRIYTP